MGGAGSECVQIFLVDEEAAARAVSRQTATANPAANRLGSATGMCSCLSDGEHRQMLHLSGAMTKIEWTRRGCTCTLQLSDGSAPVGAQHGPQDSVRVPVRSPYAHG